MALVTRFCRITNGIVLADVVLSRQSERKPLCVAGQLCVNVCVCLGLLGEAPATKPSLYSQLNVQCAILSVYLAALAQQVIAIAF